VRKLLLSIPGEPNGPCHRLELQPLFDIFPRHEVAALQLGFPLANPSFFLGS